MTQTRINRKTDSSAIREQVSALTNGVDPRARAAALSALCALASGKEGRGEILAALNGTESLRQALRSAEPKERKNAARLLSLVGAPADGESLRDALAEEKTLFVIPSLLLALGAVGGDTAKEALTRYTVPAAETAEEEKHIALIAEAKSKALAHTERGAVTPIHRLREKAELLLTYPRGFREALTRELTAAGESFRVAGDGVLVSTDDLDALYKRRCFEEALLPCGVTAFTPEAVAQAAQRGWRVLCGADDFGAPTVKYRVELKNATGDRAALIRALCGAIGGKNDPSAYSFEIRVKVLEDGRASVYVKPCAVRDVRFAYREKQLPASIRPVTAAAVASEAIALLPAGERQVLHVYDPCCGSGTMLIEAARAYRGKSLLMGTDIAQNAVLAARQNTAAALTKAVILQKDCLRFTSREPFDLILSNLPFGNRVGSHTDNVSLYRGLAARLARLIAPDGVIALYTTEATLLSDALGEHPELTILKTVRTEAGGLTPTVFFLRKEPVKTGQTKRIDDDARVRVDRKKPMKTGQTK